MDLDKRSGSKGTGAVTVRGLLDAGKQRPAYNGRGAAGLWPKRTIPPQNNAQQRAAAAGLCPPAPIPSCWAAAGGSGGAYTANEKFGSEASIGFGVLFTNDSAAVGGAAGL